MLGQMKYIEEEQALFGQIFWNINIDGAGLIKSDTSISLMQMPDKCEKVWFNQILNSPGFKLGKPWFQGDHSIFLQHGIPAVAISSNWLLNNLSVQRITHTYDDTPDLVDVSKLVNIAMMIKDVIQQCKGE